MKSFIVILISIAVVFAGMDVAALLMRRTVTVGDIITGITFAVAATIVFLASRTKRNRR